MLWYQKMLNTDFALAILVILRGYCKAYGYKRIGFGECRGTVLLAKEVVTA